MMMKITQTEILAAEVNDEPGGLALSLQALADFGANLDCVLARRRSGASGKGVVFVSAPNRKNLHETPDQAGFQSIQRIPTLKIEGTDRRGLGAEIAKIVGDQGVSMRGLTANTVGHKFSCFIGFDTTEDLKKAEAALSDFARRQSIWHRALRRKIEAPQSPRSK